MSREGAGCVTEGYSVFQQTTENVVCFLNDPGVGLAGDWAYIKREDITYF